MKIISTSFHKALLILAGLLIPAISSFAHWTTKGPYGGRVKCMIAADTLVFIGTYDGGIYRSTNKSVTAWRYANYTGLTDPSITAMSYIGNKVVAGTASGIFVSTDI